MLQLYYYWLKDRIINDGELTSEKIAADWYLRQYYRGRSAEDDGLVVHLPIVYIEIMPVTWQTLPMSIQRAVMAFRLHILTETVYVDDRNFVLPNHSVEMNNHHLDIRERIYKILLNQRVNLSDLPAHLGSAYRVDGQDTVIMESIVRTSSPTTTEQLDNMILSIEEYQSVVTDYSASPLYQKVEEVTLQIDCEQVTSFTD